ncbi:hypothetical protein HUJ04_012674 [Dendroctonus ponderosae]|nr:hypothetical protein HUJ04_012674 [Dendroctonus ponderosae]
MASSKSCAVTGRSNSSFGLKPQIFLLMDIIDASRHTLVTSAPEYPSSLRAMFLRFTFGSSLTSHSPLYFDVKVEEDTLKNVVPHSVATALASMVLPVPGGPTIKTPFQGLLIPVRFLCQWHLEKIQHTGNNGDFGQDCLANLGDGYSSPDDLRNFVRTSAVLLFTFVAKHRGTDVLYKKRDARFMDNTSKKKSSTAKTNKVYSINLYKKLQNMGYNVEMKQCGSLNLAQTKDRLIALKRRVAYNLPTGLHCELLSNTEIQRKHPYLRVDDLEGGVWVPDDAVINPKAICDALALLAQKGGANYIENTTVTNVLTNNNCVQGVETDKGIIQCEYFVNCAGMWARELGLHCDPKVRIPAYPAEHFYATADQDMKHPLPVVRCYDSYTYAREYQNGLMVGWFEPEAKPAFEKGRVPKDWPKHGAGGIGKAISEWIIEGEPRQDLLPFILQRFLNVHNSRHYLKQRIKEVVGRHYSILYPFQCEYKYARELRCSPLYSVLKTRGAVFGIKMAYERALYFDSTYEKGQQLKMPQGTFFKPKFFDFVKEEYLACIEGVGIIDMSSFSKIEIKSPGNEALQYLQRICSNDIDVPVGSIVHTGMQNVRGGYENDCMLVRQTANRVDLNDLTSMYTVLNVVGPKSTQLLSELSNSDVKVAPFSYMKVNVGYASDVMVMSFTHTGEPGYCLYIPSEYALHVYYKLMTVGRDYGVRDVGVLTQRYMRLERFIPFWAEELNSFTTPYEAGNDWSKEGFIGKEALQNQSVTGVRKRLVFFHFNNIDPDVDIWPWGGEPLYRNNEFVGTVTSAGYGFSANKLICLGFISKPAKVENRIVTRDYILAKDAVYEVDIAVLLKNIEEGVATHDLNQVQQDLKKLQWTMRTRFFQGEYAEPKKMDPHQERNGYPDSSSLKRKRADDTSICRDIKNDLRLIKRDLGFHEKKFLDALIQETSKNSDKKVQEISNADEPVAKCSRKMSDSKRNGLHLTVDAFGAVTQKLLSALIQDKPPVSCSDKAPHVTRQSENGAKSTKIKNRNSLDRRLLKELVDQGILTPEDINKVVLQRNVEEGVAMDDLDQLQQDLEKLLCTNAIRTRFFLGEYSQAEQKNSHIEKRGHDRVSLKRKRPDEKFNCKDVKKNIKRDPFRSYSENSYKEIPKITLPRNDNSDKFFASIEPYCAPVSKDDVVFLDTLIQEFSKTVDKNIPDIGEHYASSWSEELLNEEQNENGSKVTKVKASESSKVKVSTGHKVGSCLDKRLLKELVEQGLLSNDDDEAPDDEILSEIKKSYEELNTVNKFNLEELNKLRSAVLNDIHCNELKDDLNKIDKEVLDLYNNIMRARLQDDGKDYDKIFSEKTINEFECKANALLRQQHVLNREINKDEKDPAIEVVNSLIEKYPKVQTDVFIGGSTVGVNPKINNMHKAFEASNYDLILISDSGIRMKEDTLQDMVNHMTERTGIVHQMPFTSDRNGFAATLEKIYFGTAQSRMYLSADCVRVNCHTGMSTLMRKHVLEEEGGLKSFGCYLAEDFFISKHFLDKGWKTTISSQPAMQNSGVCDVHSFQARLTRWAKLRMAMLPLVIVFEPLSECMVIGACAGWATSLLFRWEPLVFYLIHILVWFLCDWLLLSIVQNGSLPFSKFEFIIGWLFRECTGPYLFILAVFDPSIRWRNRCFKLAWGGIAQEVSPRSKC